MKVTIPHHHLKNRYYAPPPNAITDNHLTLGPDATTLEPNDTGHVQHPWFVTPNVLQIGGTPRPNSRIPINYYLMDDSLVRQGSRTRNTIGDLQAPQSIHQHEYGGGEGHDDVVECNRTHFT